MRDYSIYGFNDPPKPLYIHYQDTLTLLASTQSNGTIELRDPIQHRALAIERFAVEVIDNNDPLETATSSNEYRAYFLLQAFSSEYVLSTQPFLSSDNGAGGTFSTSVDLNITWGNGNAANVFTNAVIFDAVTGFDILYKLTFTAAVSGNYIIWYTIEGVYWPIHA
jgi:hypothetical protein